MDRAEPTLRSALDDLAPTIFHEPWWMRIACDGAEREVSVSRGGQRVGRLPFLASRGRVGLNVIGMPLTAHVLGPAVVPSYRSETLPRSIKQISIIGELIAQLPAASHVSFRLHGGITNTLAFDAAGFSSSVGYTVEIMPCGQEQLWAQMRDKTRNLVRRAEERLSVCEMHGPGQFADFQEDNLRARGQRNHYDRRITTRLMEECLRRGVGRMLGAYDATGDLHAAIFTVWDHERESYFMSTRRPGAINGATSLLIWAAIQHAALNGLVFDMDGVHVRQPELPNLLLVTGFGGALKPRYTVRRTSLTVRLVQELRHSWMQRFGRPG